jgi:DNA repair protein RecO (recombination protein O)
VEWRAEGLVLSARPHGESSAIVEVFTEMQGRQAGVVRGGTGRRMAPVLQPGNQVAVVWRARLEAHLGQFTVEPVAARAARVLADAAALAGVSAVCVLIQRALPERAPHPALYHATQTLADAIGVVPDWPQLYLRWELGLLAELGFGLDLGACAVTGATEGLVWVSPRTGRAVTAAAARGWEDRLLALPPCLAGTGPGGIDQGLALTGHFLARALTPEGDPSPLPEARLRLAGLVQRGRL